MGSCFWRARGKWVRACLTDSRKSTVCGRGIYNDRRDCRQQHCEMGWNELVFIRQRNSRNGYAGGEFAHFLTDGSYIYGLTQWDGASWTRVGGITVPDFLEASTLAGHNHALYVGGSFTSVGGISVSNLAKWDGTNWSSLGFSSPTRCDPIPCFSLNALAVNGKELFVAGPANSLQKWNGTNWLRLFLSHSTGSPGVSSLAASGTELFVGGAFTEAGGKLATNIARWRIPHKLNIKRAGNDALISWPATGSNLTLQARTNIALQGWSNLPDAVALHGEQCVVTNPISGKRFFRLQGR